MRINENRWPDLFLFLSILLGAAIRFAPTVLAGTVINDGGMFYVMVADLKASHFLIPAFTSYNRLNIPFAYPPLSLYAGGLISLLGMPVLDVLRWLPPLISTLTIPAFFWMARLMLESESKAGLAALAYAMMPRTFSWYIMGGGLSRSFGLFFLLLTCASAWALFARPAPKRVLLTILFGTGAVLSHPELGLHTAAACALIWLFNGRSRRGLRDAAIASAGVLLGTAPWWATVLIRHGAGPFLSAFGTGGHSAFFWLSWITLDFAEERFIALLTVVGLVGLAVQCVRRNWFLPAWMLLSLAIEPRSGPAIAALPLAMAAGLGLHEVIIPRIVLLGSGAASEPPATAAEMFGKRSAQAIVGCVVFLSFFGAFFYDLSLGQYFIPPASRRAMAWASEHIPPGSRFVVLTGISNPFSDPYVEWFPAYADKTSLNTIQGQEWTLGRNFASIRKGIADLQGCVDDSPACLAAWSSASGQPFDYIYIEKQSDEKISQVSGLLLFQLRQDPNYGLLFENSGAAIFERKSP
jgi:hypothetical protein